MRIVQSNRLTVLADDLLDHWPAADLNDLGPTSIVVPSLGMARWLTYRIAAAFSICAQVRFVYPASYVWSLFAAVSPELCGRSPFDASALTWRIYRALLEASPELAGTALTSYLDGANARDRLGLSRRLAAHFAEILAQRPDWAPNWQRGRINQAQPEAHERWLAALWRQIAHDIPAASGKHPKDLVLQRLKKDVSAQGALPKQITVFAVPQMAPLYQEVFQALDAYARVTVYLVNPSPEFWFDLESEKQRARRRQAAQTSFNFDPKGQRLLSAFGRQMRENLSVWGVADADRQGANVSVVEGFVEPAGDKLLARLQREIFFAVASDEVQPLEAADQTVQIHVCHSLSRQLEVLHDQLLAAFDRQPSAALPLAPGEVLVLVPDIDACAPTIDAVFGSSLGGITIPYVISGRSADRESPLINALFALLALPQGRFAVNAIMDLLAVPALAARFAIDAAANDTIFTWLKATGVHWGLDGGTRIKLGLPADGKHSFAEGIAALLMGYASASRRATVIDGVMPYPDIEGKDAEVLGSLTRFLSAISSLEERLSAPRPPLAWIALLGSLVEQFFERSLDRALELSRLEEAFSALADETDASAFKESVPLAVMVDALRHKLNDNAPGAVPTGSVTFCAFGPLRQIPYRMVCMLELNGDGRFPRNPQRLEFDLLARQHRPGDRNLLDEDRAAFLDALIAAGDRLHCFYTGRSMRDNAVLPPSSVLDDLIESLASLTIGGRPSLTNRVLIEHPLQPFSPRYFQAGATPSSLPTPGLFSYAAELLPSANSALGKRLAGVPFFSDPLAEPDERYRNVEVALLARALHDPLALLFEERLGMRLREDDRLLEDDEPAKLSALGIWQLRERLLTLVDDGVAGEDLLNIGRAFPEAPPGVPGDVGVLREIETTERFAGMLDRLRPRALAKQPYVLSRGPFRLLGSLDGLHPEGRISAQLKKMGGRELMRAWLDHLVMQLLSDHDQPLDLVSTLVCADAIATFKPCADPGAMLDDLLDVYWTSLLEPVPLIPSISYTYVEQGADRAAREAAKLSFIGNRKMGFIRAEQRAYRTLYGGVPNDLPPGFEAAATRVWGPVVDGVERTAMTDLVAPVDDDD